MQFWIVQTLNSLALGGLLFLLAAGFSLIFGLMRIANLTHGSLFMLGAYLGVTALRTVPNLWVAALLSGVLVAAFGVVAALSAALIPRLYRVGGPGQAPPTPRDMPPPSSDA